MTMLASLMSYITVFCYVLLQVLTDDGYVITTDLVAGVDCGISHCTPEI